MSNEALLGILITVVVGFAGFFIANNKKNIGIKNKNKNGTINMKDNIIGNEIHINKDEK